MDYNNNNIPGLNNQIGFHHKNSKQNSFEPNNPNTENIDCNNIYPRANPYISNNIVDQQMELKLKESSANDKNYIEEDDLSIIQKINAPHQKFKKILSNRKTTLSRLAKFCIDKDIPSTLNYLNMINEQPIYHDFLNFSLLQSETIKIPLTLDNANILMTRIYDLINSSYHNYRLVGIKCATVILELFTERIITTKNAVYSQGIDLSREDRVKKCNKLVEQFINISNLDIIRFILSKHDREENEVFCIYFSCNLLLRNF